MLIQKNKLSSSIDSSPSSSEIEIKDEDSAFSDNSDASLS